MPEYSTTLEKTMQIKSAMNYKLFGFAALALLSTTAANAAVVQLGTISQNAAFERVFNLNDSDYVSEQDIASDTLYFTLTSATTAVFYANNFNFNNSGSSNYEFRQIDILNTDLTIPGAHDNNWLASVGDYYNGLNGAPAQLTYNFQPGNYQVNFKSRGLESGFTGERDNPTRVVGHAVQGLGDYTLGFVLGTGADQVGAGVPSVPIAANFNFPDTPVVAAVPEPETYAMMLAGLGLIGFSACRRKTT